MIRKTIAATQAATFCLEIPDPNRKNMHTPMGTGFFVSPDGLFVTAAHVVMNPKTGALRQGFGDTYLMKEGRGMPAFRTMYQWPTVEHLDVSA